MKELIFDVAQERILTLAKEISRLKNKEYPSNAPKLILNTIEKANDVLSTKIKQYFDSDELKYLDEDRVEIILKRFTMLIPLLYQTLNFIEGSEIEDTPTEIIIPLERVIRKYINKSDVIFVTKPDLNFYFLEISKPFRSAFKEIFSDEEKEFVFKDFPIYFLWIAFPSAKYTNVLLLSLIAHEFGHGIYQEKNIGESLFPYIKINKDKIKKISQAIYDSLKSKEGEEHFLLIPPETLIRESISKQINTILKNWLEEVTSDMIGYYLFGPAFFFAFIHLLIPIKRLDSCSMTHPSSRIRLKALSTCMKKVEYEEYMSLRSKEELIKWSSYSDKKMNIREPIYNFVADTIIICFNQIADAIKSNLSDLMYSSEGYKINELSDRLVNIIPANEYFDSLQGKYTPADIIPVFNAGWEVYLSRLKELCKNLASEDINDCKEKLNKLILSTIDLIEIKLKWDEAKNK